MLARTHRLPTPLIKEVSACGARVSSRFFSGKVLLNKDKTGLQVALVVAKKTARTAVRRNRIRRRTAALTRQLTHSPAVPLRLVVFPSAAVFDADTTLLKADFEVFITKLLVATRNKG